MTNKWVWVVLFTSTLFVVFSLKPRVWKLVAPQKLQSAQMLPLPKAFVDFTLDKNVDEVFTQKNFNGKWSLIFFGYTSCPDFCPLELQKLGKVLSLAKNSNQQQIKLQIIFISLDPERDNFEKLNSYTAFFHPQIQAVSGNHLQLAKVVHFVGSDYSRKGVSDGIALEVPAGVNIPASFDKNYQVDHSARIYIVNPRAEYVGSFPPPHDAEQIFSDMQLVAEK